MKLDDIHRAILQNAINFPGQSIRKIVSGIDLTPPALYLRASDLEKAGLIKFDLTTAPGRKLARITAKGRRALDEM